MRAGQRLAALARRLVMAATFHRRAVTLGVRVAVFDERGHVLLVRHRYMPGWYLPGGAVDPGESAPEAALRELSEEAGLAGRGDPLLVGLYRNLREGGRDHVALYRIDGFERQAHALAPNREIAEARFFSPASLPEGTTPATLRRLAEIAGAPGRRSTGRRSALPPFRRRVPVPPGHEEPPDPVPGQAGSRRSDSGSCASRSSVS